MDSFLAIYGGISSRENCVVVGPVEWCLSLMANLVVFVRLVSLCRMNKWDTVSVQDRVSSTLLSSSSLSVDYSVEPLLSSFWRELWG